MDAIKHLPPINNKSKNKKKIDLIVIRVDMNGNLKNSKPCFKCIKYLDQLRFYKLKNVYYSNDDGDIILIKFSELKFSNNIHVSKRFKYNKYFK